ncbi:MAG: O-antigen ligase family protein [Actinomycetota bacterium]|nr:O-antigen ligase family protein [Actinomycetota bacterium]
MSSVVATPGVAARTRSYGFPLTALFSGFVVWWALGLGGFIWAILAVPMLGSLLVREKVHMPRGLGIWLLFLFWVALSATQLDEPTRMIVFGYRLALYIGAGIVFLYVYNAPRERLSDKRVSSSLASLWVLVVLGGFAGLMFSSFSFHSLTEQLMPGGFLADKWLHDMVHIDFAEGANLRPNSPFTYTNEWGANFALLTPFALMAIGGWRSRPSVLWPLLIAASFVPLVLSTNRGAWISLAGGVVYICVTLVLRGRGRAFAGLLLMMGVMFGLLVATPLGTTLQDALSQRESTETRFNIYEQTGSAVLESPLLGYGAPRPSPDPTQPPLGTHGQLWMVTFSHGIPGGLLYISFLAVLFVQTRRGRSRIQLFAHMTVAIAIIQLPFYGALPGQIFVVMVAAGLALRDRDADALHRPQGEPMRDLNLARAAADPATGT